MSGLVPALVGHPQGPPSGQEYPTSIRQTSNISDHGPVLSTVRVQEIVPDAHPGYILSQVAKCHVLSPENVAYEEEPPWLFKGPSYPEALTGATDQNFSWFV